MIFVTVGTHEQPFDRLIRKVDALKKQGVIQEEVIMQTGFSTYEPECCQWSKLDEHVNDHQLEFARQVAQRMGTIIPVEDIDTLGTVITDYDAIVADMGHGMCSNNAKFNERFEQIVEEMLK